MAFLARPLHDNHDHDHDRLAALLKAAGATFTHTPAPPPRPSPPPSPWVSDMASAHKSPHLQVHIALASDVLVLKGTGVDVDPAVMSGNVVLDLAEPTSIKQIVLQFRGKARIPLPANDASLRNNTHFTYVLCQHDWSFLEGAKKHSHTLKPGRHLFPFTLNLGGSLPSSIATSVFGGANITYKLRATVARSGLLHNDIHTAIPVFVMRSLAREALEYQQTLEIENTWPGKLMYAVMIPHKAWAAGDSVLVCLKFSPIVKGTRVKSIMTILNETTRMYMRTGTQENTRSIVSARHEVVNGQAVLVEETHHRLRIPLLHHTPSSPPQTAAPRSSTGTASPPGPTSASQSRSVSAAATPPATAADSPALVSDVPASTESPQPSSGSTSPTRSAPTATADDPEASDEVSIMINIPLPKHTVPSHPLEPIHVAHRLRWSILIANPAGHTSELRCSLPIHILDNFLLDEAKDATRLTRRIVIEDAQDAAQQDPDNRYAEPDEGAQLPSYSAHVRDRVANAFVDDAAWMRVTNPWVHNLIDPVSPWSPGPADASGWVSPSGVFESHYIEGTSHLPSNPRSGTSTPLEWVNSELLLSLSGAGSPPAPTSAFGQTPPTAAPAPAPAPAPPASQPPTTSGSNSRPSFRRQHSSPGSTSQTPSRRTSRASSPERSSGTNTPGAASASDTHVHQTNAATRLSHGLFSISMKPLSSMNSPWTHHPPAFSMAASSMRPISGGASTSGLGSPPHSASVSRSNSAGDLQSLLSTASGSGGGGGGGGSSGAMTPLSASGGLVDPSTGAGLLHRAFTEVPDYSAATRGFLGGGVTPLSSMVGLPSYQDAARRLPTSLNRVASGSAVSTLASVAETRVDDASRRSSGEEPSASGGGGLTMAQRSRSVPHSIASYFAQQPSLAANARTMPTAELPNPPSS